MKRVLIVLKFFLLPSYQKEVDPCCEYGLAENLAIRNLHDFWNLEINYGFFGLDVVKSISRHVKNDSNIILVLQLCKIA